MTIRFSRYDTVDYLATEADITAYLAAAEEDGDPSVVTAAQQDAERARIRWNANAGPLPEGDVPTGKPKR